MDKILVDLVLDSEIIQVVDLDPNVQSVLTIYHVKSLSIWNKWATELWAVYEIRSF